MTNTPITDRLLRDHAQEWEELHEAVDKLERQRS